MKPDIRWQVLFALVGLSLVLMLLSFQVQSAGLCTVTLPASGGTFVEGLVGRPGTLNPLLSDPYPVDRELVNLVFDGLVRVNEFGDVLPALAESWSYSDDGLTITFSLRSDTTWHDGQPVTAEDVAFTYGLMQDDEFSGSRALVDLWQPVVINVIDDRHIAFTLPQPYAPFIEATSRGILPSHLLADVSARDLASSAFNRTPIGTGPFMVEPGQDWTRTNRLRLLPNPSYWRAGTQIGAIEMRFFPSADDLITAFRAGELQGVNDLAAYQLPGAAVDSGSRLFTSRQPRFAALLFNLGDTGSASIKSAEVRQALAYGLDRGKIVDEALAGQGIEFEGPYLPSSWAYRPDLQTRYEHSLETAVALLDGAGWPLGNGSIRQREDSSLSLRLLALDESQARSVAEEIAGQWRSLGAEVLLLLAPSSQEYRRMLDEGSFDVALVDINTRGDPDLYDFWSQEAIVRGQNYGQWNNRRASEALEAARQILPRSERATYYESFLRQYAADVPALTLFQYVRTYILRDDVQQAEIGRVWEARDRFAGLSQWFLNFREVAVSCPVDGSS